MAKKEGRFSNQVNIKNRKARFEYTFIDNYTSGIVLKGTEIKSIREGKVSLQEAYCYFNEQGELCIKGMNIAPYENASYENHDPTRTRKLLLKKVEIKKLLGKIDKGLTIVPTRLFISTKGYAKLNISLAKGKKLYDKREDIKKKDVERELRRLKP